MVDLRTVRPFPPFLLVRFLSTTFSSPQFETVKAKVLETLSSTSVSLKSGYQKQFLGCIGFHRSRCLKIFAFIDAFYYTFIGGFGAVT